MRISTTLLFSLAWLCPRVWAQTPPPEFDVEDSPISATELAKELGYEFYGATWKFSVPTYARVRVWADDGPASGVPEQPPESAKMSDVFAPDNPLKELTIHALERNKVDATNRHGAEYKHIGIEFKINASGKEAPETPDPSETRLQGTVSTRMSFGEGAGTTLSLNLEQGPDQGFNHEWRYANGNLGLMFQGIATAVAGAVAHPGATGQAASAEAIIRDHAEAGMRAAPLKICYYKGEVSGLSEKNRTEGKGGTFDQVQKRAVVLVTLECSLEPFKDDAKAAAPTVAPTPATAPAATSPQ